MALGESCCFQEDDDIPSESSATKQALVAGSLVFVSEQVFVVARCFPIELINSFMFILQQCLHFWVVEFSIMFGMFIQNLT